MSKGKIILLVLAALAVSFFGVVFWAWRNGSVLKVLTNEVGHRIAPQSENFLSDALGFAGTRNYLLLFLNNTELRPGGGFIGMYSILRFDKGAPSLLKVEGTEGYDNDAKVDFESVPPAPISKYLGVKRWYFRDSNWSPDFAVSSEKSMDLFLKQGHPEGVDRIDAVIGFTPAVVEGVLKISGPISIDGQEYNDKNFTEKIQYEVEYGYANKGIEHKDRKSIISKMASDLLSQLKFSILKNWSQYYALSQDMLAQKQIVIFSTNKNEQDFLVARGYSGTMMPAVGDYLLWSDANLGALKTDASITRDLSYTITPTTGDKFLATAKMKFIHNGNFDWRTSRYRDYARVFVPKGSWLVTTTGQMDMERSAKPGQVDMGVENGYQWFGAFIAIEPGKTGELSFSYYLPDNVVNSIKNNEYNLAVQKQIGTNATKLTLGLNFGKNLVAAWPGEGFAKHGDGRYDLITDLIQDRSFKAQLAN